MCGWWLWPGNPSVAIMKTITGQNNARARNNTTRNSQAGRPDGVESILEAVRAELGPLLATAEAEI